MPIHNFIQQKTVLLTSFVSFQCNFALELCGESDPLTSFYLFSVETKVNCSPKVSEQTGKQNTYHQAEHTSPSRTHITKQNTYHQAEHTSPSRTHITKQNTHYQAEHISPSRTPITKQNTYHQAEHISPSRTHITKQNTYHNGSVVVGWSLASRPSNTPV